MKKSNITGFRKYELEKEKIIMSDFSQSEKDRRIRELTKRLKV